jgi:DegV family protein with EDD domain
MSKVGIVTDSISCLDPKIVNDFGIKIVPVSFNINGKTYRDTIDLTPEDFWKIFPTIKEFGTAAPSPNEYISIFEELSKTKDSIACTFVSRALSATSEVAEQARKLFLETHPGYKIEIIDSRTAAGAQGFVALEMARAAEAGKSLSEIIEVAKGMIPKVRFVCALETLKLLIKTGRAPKTAYVGELIKIKPIIGMLNNTGLVENLTRVRGMEKSLFKLVDLVGEYVTPDKPAHINVHYSNSLENGEKLKKLITDRFKCSELYFTPYSPLMCGAVGPCLAVAFYS